MIPILRGGAVALFISMAAGGSGAFAQGSEPEPLGQFKDWAAYSYKAADTKVCYISSQPKSTEPKTAKRDPVFLLVTHMPGRKVRGEVSTIIGYPFKKDTTVELKVDDAAYQLFTNADGAWADSGATERKIVAAMKTGTALTVKGTSWRGTETLDSYSLDGVSAALKKIDEACK